MITTNAAEVIAMMNGVIFRAEHPKPVLERVAEHQASQVMLEIMDEKHDPDEHPWAAWMPSTRKQRTAKGNAGQGLLWDRGDLLASIRVNVKNNEMQIGTSIPFAPYLQYGTRRMQPRPFLGWGKRDMEVAERWVSQYIAGPLS
jgi:phage gpG-like protein